MKVKGYAAPAAGEDLRAITFERTSPGPRDIVIDILYCGLCHSDLNMLSHQSAITHFPMVPGHEIVGRVSSAGSDVTRFAVGDLAAIGCYVDSCRHCAYCEQGLEQYCDAGPTPPFSSIPRGGGPVNQGGFSSHYVVDAGYALKLPLGLDPAAAAPLLCAGACTFSPLRHWKAGPGTRLGVFGLGGLGHLAVKFGRALGSDVTLFTTSEDKTRDALALGAHRAVLSTDSAAMAKLRDSLDLIIDTASAAHEVEPLLSLLRVDGTLCMLGIPRAPVSIMIPELERKRRAISGSMMSGLAETQEMLDFAALHGIAADIEVMPVSRVNEAIDRLRANDVRYRFVLDMAELHG